MAIQTQYVKLLQIHETAAQWQATNPTLFLGELGLESDTLRWKFGNGSSNWNTLPYATQPSVTVTYNNRDSMLVSADVQAAIDELAVQVVLSPTLEENSLLTTSGNYLRSSLRTYLLVRPL